MPDGDAHAESCNHGSDGQERPDGNAEAGPSKLKPAVMTNPKRLKASKPFVSADHRPEAGDYDNTFRVVIITSGSVASVKLPLIVGRLCRV